MAREVRENSKATKQKRFIVVYEGSNTHIAEIVGSERFGTSFREAKKEAMACLEGGKRSYDNALRRCRSTLLSHWEGS